jgi:selenium metabolism protein YedF
MKMRIIDTKGQACPAPIIAVKKALREANMGEAFKLLTDNKTSLENLSRFLNDNRTEFSVEESGGFWTITVTKKDSGQNLTKSGEYCNTEIPHFTKGDFIIVFSSDKMGEGDEELGKLLMNNFIKAIKDLDHLPQKMVFYNNGIKMGSADSGVSGYLRELEKMGVGLLFCATCVKFYHLEEKIKIGILSNMFEIARVMASSGNIIKP